MQTFTKSFCEKVSRISVQTIAQALGLHFAKNQKSAGPCPACRHSVRSKSKGDRRPPVSFRDDGKGWECQHCHEKGDGLDLVSFFIAGDRYKNLLSHNQTNVRDWYDQQGFTDYPVKNKKLEISNHSRVKKWQQTKIEQKHYVPIEELVHIWESSLMVCEDQDAIKTIESWTADVEAVMFHELARVLPKDGPHYPWMEFGRHSWRDGWRLLIPIRDEKGRPKGFKARWIHEDTPIHQRKSLTPKGYQVKGTINADKTGQIILKTGQTPTEFDVINNIIEVRIVEGEKDFIATAGQKDRKDEREFAVFGIWQGSWLDEFTRRIPKHENIHIIIATDPDEKGEKYARKIRLSFLKHGFHKQQIKRRLAGVSI